MADKELSAITAGSTPLSGTETLHVVQSGNSRRITVQDIADIVPAGLEGLNALDLFDETGTADSYGAWSCKTFNGGSLTLAPGEISYFHLPLVDARPPLLAYFRNILGANVALDRATYPNNLTFGDMWLKFGTDAATTGYRGGWHSSNWGTYSFDSWWPYTGLANLAAVTSAFDGGTPLADKIHMLYGHCTSPGWFLGFANTSTTNTKSIHFGLQIHYAA